MDKWSPELISQRFKKEGRDCVSHETIYKWIWQAKESKQRHYAPYTCSYKELKQVKRKRKRGNIKDNRGAFLNRTPISGRPTVVELRKRGDIEVDLMIGKDHKSALLLMTDRTTLVTMIEKLSGKQANEVYDK